MRTLWKGAVSFGLVNIPIKMYVATERKDIKFNYLHKECMSPIQYRKFCPNCNREIASEEIVRGYEYQKGNFVVINEEDLERIPLESTKTIDILDFVDLAQVDPIYFDKTYYLEPSQGGEKAYTLLIEAMTQTSKVAIAKVIIRSKQTLAALRVKDQVLIMETIFWPDEIRSPSALDLGVDRVKLHDNEIKMAVSLIENLSTDFEPAKYQDEHRQALWELIESKIVGKEVVAAAPAADRGNVVDLMEALKASVKLAEENRNAQQADSEPRQASRGRRKTKTGS
ncbi:MAG TPA: Ku protein [Syntrophomonadaceae bacterium]|nr:Ku protein [Syntrophomonadaceae bacterium]HQA06547.1 Ku protein [Syntrophomonadaceae bacterium]HQE22472.1 Ku protein [Syntrophomonadaceae bacterium]